MRCLAKPYEEGKVELSSLEPIRLVVSNPHSTYFCYDSAVSSTSVSYPSDPIARLAVWIILKFGNILMTFMRLSLHSEMKVCVNISKPMSLWLFDFLRYGKRSFRFEHISAVHS